MRCLGAIALKKQQNMIIWQRGLGNMIFLEEVRNRHKKKDQTNKTEENDLDFRAKME